jgi:hypothetical protein
MQKKKEQTEMKMKKKENIYDSRFSCSLTGSYNYGYEVGPNRQFHHEIRGNDGVTYGCFGYQDPDSKFQVTHYVADAHGYRLVQSNKPVKIFPIVPDPK